MDGCVAQLQVFRFLDAKLQNFLLSFNLAVASACYVLYLPCSSRPAPKLSRHWSPALWLPPLSASCGSNVHLPCGLAMAACLGEEGEELGDWLMHAAFLEYMLDV
jgi:hypothetical protein